MLDFNIDILGSEALSRIADWYMLVYLIFKVSDKWLNIDTTEEKIKYELNILLGVQSNELFLLTIDIFSVIQYWRMDDDHHVLFIMITSITIIQYHPFTIISCNQLYLQLLGKLLRIANYKSNEHFYKTIYH